MMRAFMLAPLFNRLGDPARIFRFRKTAIALVAASWIPFAGGLYSSVTAVHADAARPAQEQRNYTQLMLSLAAIGGSYAVGYGAMAYLYLGRRYRPEPS